jgi:hypothetical protein
MQIEIKGKQIFRQKFRDINPFKNNQLNTIKQEIGFM